MYTPVIKRTGRLSSAVRGAAAAVLALALIGVAGPGAEAAVVAPVSVGSVSAGTNPGQVAIDESARRIYVTNFYGNSITVLDADDNSLVATVPVPKYPESMALDAARHRLYVTQYSTFSGPRDDDLTVIDTQSLTVIGNVALPGTANDVAVDTTTHRVYVPGFISGPNGFMTVLDGTDDSVVATVTLGGNPLAVSVDEATERVFVANYLSSTLSVIDGATNTVLDTIPTGANPDEVVFVPGRNQILILNRQDSEMWVLDGSDYHRIKAVSTNQAAEHIAVSEQTGATYVTNSYFNHLTVYDVDYNQVADIPLDASTSSLTVGVALDSVTGRIYATGWSTGKLWIFQEQSPPAITTDTLPAGTVGVAYSADIAATGSAPPSFSVSSGTLPAGLTLDPDGHLHGTPEDEGSSDITVTASNPAGSDTHDYTIAVASPPRIVTESLPEARAGSGYSARLDATGTAPLTWSVESGGLPTGLTLDGATGEITGAATVAGSYSVTIGAENTAGSDSAEYALNVVAGPLASLDLRSSTTTAAVGESATLSVSGADVFGNPLGDVTGEAVFTSDHPDTIDGPKVTFTSASTHLITATIGAVSDSIAVEVSPADSTPDPSTTPTDPSDPSTSPTDSASPSTSPPDSSDPSASPSDSASPSISPVDPSAPSTSPHESSGPGAPDHDPGAPPQHSGGLAVTGATAPLLAIAVAALVIAVGALLRRRARGAARH